jgi:hypothetical protein
MDEQVLRRSTMFIAVCPADFALRRSALSRLHEYRAPTERQRARKLTYKHVAPPEHRTTIQDVRRQLLQA